MIAVLSIDSRVITCLCGMAKKDGSYSVVAQATAPYTGIRKKRAISSYGFVNASSEAIEQAEEIAGKHIREIHVGVPGSFCEIDVSRPLPQSLEDAGEPALVDKALYMDNENELIHRIQMPRRPGGAQRGPDTVISILANRDYIKEMNAALAAKNARPASFISQNFAEGLFIIPQIARDNVAIMLNVGYYNIDVCVFQGDAQVFSGTLNVGGHHIVTDLAQVLEIDLKYAEQLKRQFAFGIRYDAGATDYVRMDNGKLLSLDHALVEKIIQARMDETGEFIRNAMEECGVAFTEKTKVFMTGDGLSDMRGAREYLGALIGWRIEALPIDMVDGTTRYSTTALSLFDYAMNRQVKPAEQAQTPKPNLFKKVFSKR